MKYQATGFLLAFLCFPPAVFGQSDAQHHHADTLRAEQYGSVHFPISCSDEAQHSFERGVAMLHSFEYEDAETTFADVARREPNCAMAYWGEAASYYHPHWQPPDAAHLKLGRESSERAVVIGGKTPREQEYITAIAGYYRESERLDSRTRALNYQKAMEHLYTAYPDDREAALFYALLLISNAPPRDPSYADQRKPAPSWKKSSLSRPIIQAWLITLSTPMTTPCWPTARWQQLGATPRLRLLRSMPCTCRRTSSSKWDRGRKPSIPIFASLAAARAWVVKSQRTELWDMQAHARISSPMPTCKPDRMHWRKKSGMKLAATATDSEKAPWRRTRRSWGFLLVTH